MISPILEAVGLSKSFGEFKAVADVSLQVLPGTVHALIGPNGAGKTTLFNLLTKVHEPSAGKIIFRGSDITALASHEIARLGMVRSFQISSIFPELTAGENLCVALQWPLGLGRNFWTSDQVLDRFKDRSNELLKEVGLEGLYARPAGLLPYGERRALEIATTLALNPPMLLLDEPMAGLSRDGIELISELIRRIAVDRTILMVEHNLAVVERLCDTISVLQRGEVLVEGDYETVANDPRVIEAYIGGELEAEISQHE